MKIQIKNVSYEGSLVVRPEGFSLCDDSFNYDQTDINVSEAYMPDIEEIVGRTGSIDFKDRANIQKTIDYINSRTPCSLATENGACTLQKNETIVEWRKQEGNTLLITTSHRRSVEVLMIDSFFCRVPVPYDTLSPYIIRDQGVVAFRTVPEKYTDIAHDLANEMGWIPSKPNDISHLESFMSLLVRLPSTPIREIVRVCCNITKISCINLKLTDILENFDVIEDALKVDNDNDKV